MQVGKDDNDPDIDMYVFWGADVNYKDTLGTAPVGTTCRQFYKTSMNEYQQTTTRSAIVRLIS